MYTGSLRYISQTFDVPSSYVLSESTARYYGSLVPSLEILRTIKKINFCVKFPRRDDSRALLAYENGINPHLFKPRYSALASSELNADVSSYEVLAHTLRALAVFQRSLVLDEIVFSVRDEQSDYLSYCGTWKLHRRVLLCWKESFLKFLKLHWLLGAGVDEDLVRALAKCLENRLESDLGSVAATTHAIEQTRKVRLSDFERQFHLTPLSSDSSIAEGVNLRFDGEDISVIQLPWGISLSRNLGATIACLQPELERIGLVGGVGYIGTEPVELEDMFLPESVYLENAAHTACTQQYHNCMQEVHRAKYFKPRAIWQGAIASVVPTEGVLSNSRKLAESGIALSAIDMEFAGIFEKFSPLHGVQIGSAHYIMDIPARGIGLGDTYYHRPYLERIFGVFNRGKYSCFERALNFLSSPRRDLAMRPGNLQHEQNAS